MLRGTHYAKKRTLVGVIAADGIKALRVQEKAVNDDNFLDFTHQELIPSLKEDEIVCMDQLRAHKQPEVIDALRTAGVRVLFLPTYSPELNAIEPIWNWVKHGVSKRFPRALGELDAAVESVWKLVTPKLCRACIEHCGYVLLEETNAST